MPIALRRRLFWRSPRRAFDASGRFRASRCVVAALQADRAVLLDPDVGAYFGLDAVGSRIWALLDEPRSAAELAELLEAEYDAPPVRLRADTEALLAALLNANLVEAV
ncbi:MAG TPA: PqqD family protein [Longimicrobiales bacterium]|nr:PqqD family protein [Longimicrobiales bacterium]